MISLAFAQVRHRGIRYVSLFFALFASVALTIAALGLSSTLVNSVNDLYAKPYVSSDYVLTVTANNPEAAQGLATAIQAQPGIESVSFDNILTVALRESDGMYKTTIVQGISEGPLHWRTLEEGHMPQGQGEIAVSAIPGGPELGSEVLMKVPASSEDRVVRVVGVVEAAAEDILGGSVRSFADPLAVAEWGSGSARGEYRIATAGGAPVLPEVPGATVTIESAGAHVDKLSDTYLGQRHRYFLVLSAFVGITAVVAALIVFSAYSVLTGERRREFGLIRAVGASTPQIVGSVLVESAVLGVLASSMGAPAGVLAARWLAQHSAQFGIKVPLEAVQVSPTELGLVVIVGVIVSVLAALPAALSVCFTSTIDALAPSAVSRHHRWVAIMWCMLAALAGGVAWLLRTQIPLHPRQRGLLLAIVASSSAVCRMLIVVALILPALLHVISRGLGHGPVPTVQLGVAFAGKQKTRSAALVAVILAGAALSSAVVHGQEEIRSLLIAAAKSAGGADISISALDNDIPPEMLPAIREIPGVVAAVAPPVARVTLPSGSAVAAFMLDAAQGAALMRDDDSGAAPGTIVFGSASGFQSTYPEGSQIQIEIADMPVTVTVVYRPDALILIDPGVVSTARELKAKDLGINVDDFPAQPVRTVFTLIDGPADQPADGATITAIRATVAGAPGRYSFSEALSARRDTAAMVQRVTTMSSLLAIVALVIAAVGLINTVVLMIAERTRDRWLLRSIGVTRVGQLLAMCTEMLALAVPAALIGALSGGVFGLYIAREVTDRDSRDLDPTLILSITTAMAVGAVLCALVGQRRLPTLA